MFRRSTIEGTFRASLLVLILSEMTSSIGPLADGIIIASYFLGEKGIAEFEILLASNYLLEAPESCVSGRSFLLSKKGSNWQKGDSGDRYDTSDNLVTRTRGKSMYHACCPASIASRMSYPPGDEAFT